MNSVEFMALDKLFVKCCERLLGCEVCIDTLYRGEGGMSKNCPQCRSERAYAVSMG